jgi:4-alpha-glucanotransferase
MMEKHGIYRMYVGQYELIAENRLGVIPSRSVASLNTHDMFPFASFWQETDILERQKIGLINEKVAGEEIRLRRQVKSVLISILQNRGLDIENSRDIYNILQAVLLILAASPAYAVLVNLEDLWLETAPQNTPGTHSDQNWSQKVLIPWKRSVGCQE